jgi:hypothetical protein
MTYANVTNSSSIDIAKYLQIQQTKGVYTNLATQSEIWKLILKAKAGKAGGRQMSYNLRTSLGPGAVQSLGAGDSGDYPSASRSVVSEAVAFFKFYGSTVNVPRQLTMLSGEAMLRNSAMDILNEELDAKSIALARVLSGQIMRDGTGVIGIVSGTPTVSAANDTLTITLNSTDANGDRSHVGWFDEGDQIKFATSAGVAHGTVNNAVTAVAYWSVVSKDEDTNVVILKPYNSVDGAVDILNATVGATDPIDGDYIYRKGTTPNDISSAPTDYGRASEELAGLAALISNDGRTVHGLAHTGPLQGTIKDCAAAQIDSTHFQQALSRAKRRAGRGLYSWENAMMYDNVYDAFAESAESDRRFTSVQDANRGFKKIGFQHGKDFVEFQPDEFCSKARIWMLPTSKEVMQFYGDDFQVVDIGGQKLHLKTSSSGAGHARAVQQYNEGAGVLICRHPASVIKITNFTA